jgi:hypothetical protein
MRVQLEYFGAIMVLEALIFWFYLAQNLAGNLYLDLEI